MIGLRHRRPDYKKHLIFMLFLLIVLTFCFGLIFYCQPLKNLITPPAPTPTVIPTPTLTSTPTVTPTLTLAPTLKPTRVPTRRPTKIPTTTATLTLAPTQSQSRSSTTTNTFSCDIINQATNEGIPQTYSFVYGAANLGSRYVTGLQWDFNDDGNWDTDLSPSNGNTSHTYSDAGIYTIRLKVQLDDNSTTQCTTQVAVQPH